jgi:hypothetical protein
MRAGTITSFQDVGYEQSAEGASAADLVKSMQAKSEPVARKGKSA